MEELKSYGTVGVRAQHVQEQHTWVCVWSSLSFPTLGVLLLRSERPVLSYKMEVMVPTSQGG